MGHPLVLQASFSSFWGFLSLVALGGGAYWMLSSRNKQPEGEPPCAPYSLPWLAHTLEWGSDSMGLIKRAKRYFGSSQPFSISLAGHRFYIVTKAADISAVYRHPKSLNFDSLIGDILTISFQMKAGDTGDGSPNIWGMIYGGDFNGVRVDDIHYFYRNALTKPDKLYTITSRTASELSRQWQFVHERIACDAKGHVQLPLMSLVREVMANAVTDAIFGPELRKRFPNAMDDLFTMDNQFYKVLAGYPRLLAKEPYNARDRLIKLLQHYCDDEEMLQHGLPVIVDRNKQIKEACCVPRERGAAALTILQAVHTNSNPASYWLFLRILTYPGLPERIVKETSPAFRDGTVDFEKLTAEHCPLLHSVWLETLRIGSNSSSGRKVLEPTKIGEFTLHAGGVLLCPSRPMQLATENWGEDALSFNPDRFLKISDNDPQMTKMRPFGGGTSLCPGRYFASAEVKIFVAIALHYFNFEVIGELPKLDENTPGQGVLKPLTDVDVRIFNKTSL